MVFLFLFENDLHICCRKCKDCDEARHQLSRKIIRLPEILVLHLDRKPPQVDENHPLYNTFRENLVEFPLKALNLSNMIEGNSSTKPLSYDLYGVIVRVATHLLLSTLLLPY